ncbi:hypothetical protein [Persephonella sp.]
MSKGFLKVAEQLYELGKSSRGDKREFAFRSAISRAYYGVLWYIRDFYGLRESEDLRIITYKALKKRNLLQVIEDLKELSQARIQADYRKKKLKITVDEITTNYYIKLALKIINSLE